jgi:hypothetical protein
MPEVRIKRGQTLHLRFAFFDDGLPVDITNATFAAQVRASDDTLVDTLTVIKSADMGVALINEPNTLNWPLGALRVDVRQTVGASVDFTETTAIYVTREVTRS